MPESSISARAGPAPSRSSRTTIPSFIEPFQGAATGVGGILRDIFTMGARPVAVMDSLRFGPVTHHAGAAESASEHGLRDRDTVHRNHAILEGVVSGVAHYGNCFGVPNLGGETRFEPCYSQNPLVNAFALGLVRKDQIFYAKAAGEGNPVIYVGAKTGRDGIHGATMASEEFSEESEQKRPNVQVGDPFLEKLLLEACLEAMQTGAVVGIQDMGAAGLTCSTCEMGARGNVGIEIELDLVPQRETGMTPYEIMLSESQERMLLVAEKPDAKRKSSASSASGDWTRLPWGGSPRMPRCACWNTARWWRRFLTPVLRTRLPFTPGPSSAGSHPSRENFRRTSYWGKNNI